MPIRSLRSLAPTASAIAKGTKAARPLSRYYFEKLGLGYPRTPIAKVQEQAQEHGDGSYEDGGCNYVGGDGCSEGGCSS